MRRLMPGLPTPCLPHSFPLLSAHCRGTCRFRACNPADYLRDAACQAAGSAHLLRILESDYTNFQTQRQFTANQNAHVNDPELTAVTVPSWFIQGARVGRRWPGVLSP